MGPRIPARMEGGEEDGGVASTVGQLGDGGVGLEVEIAEGADEDAGKLHAKGEHAELVGDLGLFAIDVLGDGPADQLTRCAGIERGERLAMLWGAEEREQMGVGGED